MKTKMFALLFLLTTQFTLVNAQESWQLVVDLPTADFITDVLVYGPRMYVSTQNEGVYTSLNSGQTWQAENSGLDGLGSKHIAMMVRRGAMIYQAIYGGGVWKRQPALMNHTTARNPNATCTRIRLQAHSICNFNWSKKVRSWSSLWICRVATNPSFSVESARRVKMYYPFKNRTLHQEFIKFCSNIPVKFNREN